MSRSAK